MRTKFNITKIRIAVAVTLAVMLCGQTAAFAATYDLANGSVTVNAGADKQTVTQGESSTEDSAPEITYTGEGSTQNTVAIKSEGGATANVTLKDVDIAAKDGEAAVTVEGSANITVEGENDLKGGNGGAGLEAGEGDSVTISGDGTLNAQAGDINKNKGAGAGIGGASGEAGGHIEITGDVTVNATGAGNLGDGYAGGSAGIGGGTDGEGGDVTISGNATVNAVGGAVQAGENNGSYTSGGAGIGAGAGGQNGGSLTVSGSASVKAQGGYNSAGIGGAGTMNKSSKGATVVVQDNAKVEATGGYSGAGIGGGVRSDGGALTVMDNADVTAKGGVLGAGVGGGGGGYYGGKTVNGKRIVSGGFGGKVELLSGFLKATGGIGGAGIGGGAGAEKAYQNGPIAATGGAGAEIIISGGVLDVTGGANAVGVGAGSNSKWTGKLNNEGQTQWSANSTAAAGSLAIYGGNGTIHSLSAGFPAVADRLNTIVWNADISGFTVEDEESLYGWTQNVPVAGPVPGPVLPEAPAPTDPTLIPVALPQTPPTVAATDPVNDADDNDVTVAAQTAQSGDPDQPVVISEGQTPLSASNPGIWGLLNLILAAASVLTGGMVLLGWAKKGKARKEETQENRHGATRLMAAAAGLAAVVTFLLTQDMKNAMALTDSYTLLMAAIALAVLVLALGAGRREKAEAVEA